MIAKQIALCGVIGSSVSDVETVGYSGLEISFLDGKSFSLGIASLLTGYRPVLKLLIKLSGLPRNDFQIKFPAILEKRVRGKPYKIR